VIGEDGSKWSAIAWKRTRTERSYKMPFDNSSSANERGPHKESMTAAGRTECDGGDRPSPPRRLSTADASTAFQAVYASFVLKPRRQASLRKLELDSGGRRRVPY
jgi:hypothetical protein